MLEFLENQGHKHTYQKLKLGGARACSSPDPRRFLILTLIGPPVFIPLW